MIKNRKEEGEEGKEQMLEPSNLRLIRFIPFASLNPISSKIHVSARSVSLDEKRLPRDGEGTRKRVAKRKKRLISKPDF